MNEKCLKGIDLTPKKLRRILRWVKNRCFFLEITDEQYGSRGESIDYWSGKIIRFTVESDGTDFKATIFLDSGQTVVKWFCGPYIFATKFRPDMLLLYQEHSMPQRAFRIKVKSAYRK